MSDMISTPSQTQSAVSNEAFEALIDLLASDGAHENKSTPPEDRVRTQPNVTLRDGSGKLDFDKIRLMFAAQKQRPFASPEPLEKEESRAQSPFVANEDGDSDDEQRPSTAPSRTSTMSPNPTERPSPGHKRSSTFGNQPLTAIQENGAAAKTDVAVPTLQPLSLDELNAALAGAQEEVKSLRQRYDELQALVSKKFGTEKRDHIKLAASAADNEKNGTGSDARTQNGSPQGQPCAPAPLVPLPPDMLAEIAQLSENEAKRALNGLVRSLNVSPSIVGPMATGAAPISSSRKLSLSNSTRQHDVASIARSVKFLGTVDELIWRRALAPSGPRTLLPVYSEENVVALLARLELWERAVRRSSRI